MLVKIVKNCFGAGVPFKFDDNTQSLTVWFVAQIGDSLYFFILNQFGDSGDKAGFINLLRNFCDDDLELAAFALFDIRFGAHNNFAAAGGVAGRDFVNIKDLRTSWKIRAFDMLH